MNQKKINAHKYFLYGIQEYIFHKNFKMENKRMQSLRELLDDFIILEKNIKSNNNDNTKLINSRKALMESILFNLENTPLIKIKDLTLDINSIKNLIKLETSNVNKNNKCLFNCISSFNKKISKISILDYFIDIHNEYDSSFKEVEILIDYYISELLYEGYSL